MVNYTALTRQHGCLSRLGLCVCTGEIQFQLMLSRGKGLLCHMRTEKAPDPPVQLVSLIINSTHSVSWQQRH